MTTLTIDGHEYLMPRRHQSPASAPESPKIPRPLARPAASPQAGGRDASRGGGLRRLPATVLRLGSIAVAVDADGRPVR